MRYWSTQIIKAAKKDPNIARKVYEIIELDLKMNPRTQGVAWSMSGKEMDEYLKRMETSEWEQMLYESDRLCQEVAEAISKKDQNEIAGWLSWKCWYIKDQIEDIIKKRL